MTLSFICYWCPLCPCGIELHIIIIQFVLTNFLCELQKLSLLSKSEIQISLKGHLKWPVCSLLQKRKSGVVAFSKIIFYIKEIPHSSYHAESGEHRINTHKNITSHVDWHGTLLSILSCLEFVRTGG